ncbi:efflux RND transporter periplasmic adaptor subunit [Thalassovita aquimarina]|uniref:HlyD family efflux transporter periplasmic adaptor subunit n=1 Tax=Thalassovita aquimarina TaxID=2785917 RepID=A0ABS5HQQ7_9RHOB|nr:HlyD family efflux transporter periplasmic adaptor subunit [Thalassovita aquimarina]MBR9651286.1 HlyD family efflux transporter periplasmic adaptor subunit [Thalassovita aquimarina]
MTIWLAGLSRVLAVAVPLALGALSIAYSDQLAQPPAGKERQRPPTPVRVITLEPVMLTPRTVGYGQIQPAREWRAVARVEGEVVETSDLLAGGEIAPGGTVLLRIDDADIKLTLAQIDAQMRALEVKNETLAVSLDLVEKDLELSRNDVTRQEDLAERGVASAAALDQARRQELAARGKVAEINNQLALNAAERDVLVAQRASAARSLDFTTITAPYDLRITSVAAEQGQVVNRGQALLTAEGIDAVEVAAQFPLGRMGPVVRALGPGGTVMDLKAKVRLPAPGHVASWDAQVMRVAEAIDARTQSTGIVVRIDDPLGQAAAGQRPPLRRNTFVSVELSAPPRDVLAAPLDAVRDGRALVVNAEGKLEPRAVETAYSVGSIAVITGGVGAGEQLVVTDPAVAVPGMAVKPMEDKALKAEIARLALGAEPAK